MRRRRILIMGAAGRDFHNFNTVFRNDPNVEVVAFTATQIPDIEGRKYPKELAGPNYPNGIDIYPQDDLDSLVKEKRVDEVVFAYSDVPYEILMHIASQILALGADFRLIGGHASMVKSTKPVIAICAVRTGAGKSQTTRRVAKILTAAKKKVVVIRHPMPYGDLVAQRVQRFAALDDLKRYHCTIEEMEEYEPHIERGNIVYAGVDYEAILREAEKEADIILWDGGNNDTPFYKPDFMITVADPLRAGDEVSYYPGETNLRMADVVIINKIDSADPEDVDEVRATIREVNPKAIIIEAASPIMVENGDSIRGKRVLVVEDGPTLTHGEMTFGAGVVAAEKYGAADLVDPREFAVGSIAETFDKYPDIGVLLPAMGYGDQQVKDLEATIQKCEAELVIIGTPIDLRRIITIDKPTVRVFYELQEIGRPNLIDVLKPFLS